MPKMQLGMRGTQLAAVVFLLLGVAACRSLPGGRFLAGMATGDYRSDAMTQQDLRLALMQYASRFEATIVATADTISAGTRDPVIQRRTLRWKLGITPVVNQAAFLAEPEAAYVAMLTVATAMQEFLTTGGGTEAFGAQQQIAVEASNELVQASGRAARERHTSSSRNGMGRPPLECGRSGPPTGSAGWDPTGPPRSPRRGTAVA